MYPEDEKTCKLSKPFIALALIPELYFEIGMTALCFKYSDKSCESPLLDYADFFESTWVATILRGRRGLGISSFHSLFHV